MVRAERVSGELTPVDRIASLREQNKEFSREGFDGHNRRSGITTIHGLGTRRSRRRWNMWLRMMALTYNGH